MQGDHTNQASRRAPIYQRNTGHFLFPSWHIELLGKSCLPSQVETRSTGIWLGLRLSAEVYCVKVSPELLVTVVTWNVRPNGFTTVESQLSERQVFSQLIDGPTL